MLRRLGTDRDPAPPVEQPGALDELSAAVVGAGRCVAVTGEAGIGKPRLLAEAALRGAGTVLDEADRAGVR